MAKYSTQMKRVGREQRDEYEERRMLLERSLWLRYETYGFDSP